MCRKAVFILKSSASFLYITLILGLAGGCAGFASIPPSRSASLEGRNDPLVLMAAPDAANAAMLSPDAATQSVCSADDLYKPTVVWRDYVGVMHVHTRYSHDADGLFEDVVRVANDQRLDFVLVSEHNTLQGLREGRSGRYGQTLVLIGMEISTESGHYLTLNVTHEVDREQLMTQEVIDAVAQQGGFGFIAHPYFMHHPWIDWSVRGFAGMEIYNASHDTFDENIARLAFWTLSASPLASHLQVISRPEKPLHAWDELIKRHGRLVGIGSIDAHEVHAFGMRFAPYEAMFQLVRTHVLSSANPLTPADVYSALQAGHVYVGVDLIAETCGFIFRADAAGRTMGIMGDEVVWQPDLTLVVHAPGLAQMSVYQNGKLIHQASTDNLRLPVTDPGVYRVELTRGGKPWIFSNPIYIRL